MQVLYSKKYIYIYTYIDCGVFNTVMYWLALYLAVGVSIGYIVIPCS